MRISLTELPGGCERAKATAPATCSGFNMDSQAFAHSSGGQWSGENSAAAY